MSYKFNKAGNPMSIKEQEYGSGSEIKFTKFTSCIGVIAKKYDVLHAVHLVMKGKDGIFDSAAAIDVVGLLPSLPEKVTIFGCIALWQNPENGVDKAFQKLLASIKSVEKYQQYTFGEGIYGAKIDGKDIEITY